MPGLSACEKGASPLSARVRGSMCVPNCNLGWLLLTFGAALVSKPSGSFAYYQGTPKTAGRWGRGGPAVARSIPGESIPRPDTAKRWDMDRGKCQVHNSRARPFGRPLCCWCCPIGYSFHPTPSYSVLLNSLSRLSRKTLCCCMEHGARCLEP